MGSSVLYFADRRLHGDQFQFNATATCRDLRFFLAGFSIALLAALLPSPLSIGPIPVRFGIAGLLAGLYLVYVYRSLQTGELIEETGLDSLYVGLVAERADSALSNPESPTNHGTDPHRGLVFLQMLLALGVIVGGAQIFVTEVQYFAVEVIHFPTAVLALLLAPLATELPEKFNSIIWISRDKDTLAIGNITGAMAFQSTIPVSIGILFTSWNLTLTWGTTGFLNALSAVLALVSGGVLYLRARSTGSGNMRPLPFLIGGLLYLVFIAVVLYHVFYLNITPSGTL